MSMKKNMSVRKRHWGPLYMFQMLAAVFIAALFVSESTLTEAAPNLVVQAGIVTPDPPTIRTLLYELEVGMVELEAFTDSGGAIEPFGNQLLLVTPRGRIALIDADGEVSYLRLRVPMNETASEDTIPWIGFRVADIVLHELLPNKHTLFVSHHYLAGDCVEFRISSILLDLNSKRNMLVSDWKTEFTANPCIENSIFGFWPGEISKVGGGIQAGGRMLMDGDDHLLIAVGDHAWYEWQERQEEGGGENPTPLVDPDSHLGKLIRIELTSGEAEVVATGFRNPQGLARDPEGKLWETEHGPLGGDELNLLGPGLDYGWPYVTHGIQYGNRPWPYNKMQGRHDGFEEPVFSWVPSIAISNLIVSDGQQFPLWKDDLLIGSLKEQSLYRVRLHEERVSYVEKIEIGERIRDITWMPDGRIAVLSDRARVLFLRHARHYCQFEKIFKTIYSYGEENVCVNVFDVIGQADDPVIRSLHGANVGSPIIQSLFDVYIHENWLIYVKSPCTEKKNGSKFFLHITPVHPEYLAEDHKQHGFNVYDFFSFKEDVGSIVLEGGCIVARAFPDYDIKQISTGQIIMEVETLTGQVSWKGPIWHDTYTIGDPRPAARPQSEDSLSTQPGLEGDHPGAPLYAAHCASCHNLAAEHNIGPHLNGVIGRRAGRVAGFTGSAALTSLDTVWTRENLAEFIASPSRFAPGTTMPDAGITAEEAQIIAEFLASGR